MTQNDHWNFEDTPISRHTDWGRHCGSVPLEFGQVCIVGRYAWLLFRTSQGQKNRIWMDLAMFIPPVLWKFHILMYSGFENEASSQNKRRDLFQLSSVGKRTIADDAHLCQPWWHVYPRVIWIIWVTEVRAFAATMSCFAASFPQKSIPNIPTLKPYKSA